jgi:hypothetical protein
MQDFHEGVGTDRKHKLSTAAYAEEMNSLIDLIRIAGA